jgi:hypothetical protein
MNADVQLVGSNSQSRIANSDTWILELSEVQGIYIGNYLS